MRMACWGDVVDAELHIAAHVLSMLSWLPLCALRSCNEATLQAHELFSSQPHMSAEICWVRVPEHRHGECLRFLAQHCQQAQRLVVHKSSRFDEKALLRLVCSLRQLETLEVEASPFGGLFPEAQRLLDRLAKYCPRLQHLSITFRHELPAERQVLSVRALSFLGRRLLTLDLGSVAVRVPGGSKTLAACCPQLNRLCAQLCYQTGQRSDVDRVSPADLSWGCPQLNNLDLSPVEWDDAVLHQFVAGLSSLSSLALRQVASHASAGLLDPIVARCSGTATENGVLVLRNLHLALHARTDVARARKWLEAVSHLKDLCALTVDYAAPLSLADIANLGAGLSGLTDLTVHGCHGVDDNAILAVAQAFPCLEKLRIFPDSYRDQGTISDVVLLKLLHGSLPDLQSLAVGSRMQLLSDTQCACLGNPAPLRSLSLFAPLDDMACTSSSIHWQNLRQLWLGPHKLMRRGVGLASLISDTGVIAVAKRCPAIMDLSIASLHVTDVGAKAILHGCPELRRLRLGGQGLTDQLIVILASLKQPRLERLTLWFSGLCEERARTAELLMPWTCFDIETIESHS